MNDRRHDLAVAKSLQCLIQPQDVFFSVVCCFDDFHLASVYTPWSVPFPSATISAHMLRDKLMQHAPVDGFRWRSHEITRVEGFSDAVFGFAVTLLIVSLELPRTSGELLATMRGFGAFVITFMMLAGLWYSQFTFFRRYGLEDRVTVILNLLLLFMVLFFVYPLKFLFNVILTDP